MNKTLYALILAVSLLNACNLQHSLNCDGDGKGNKRSDNTQQAGTEAAEVNEDNALHSELSAYVATVINNISKLSEPRKKLLDKIVTFIQSKREASEPANLIFICTHNSRRSHMSQIWAATAAAYYGLADGIHTYSGGTEATAFHPNAIAAIQRAGFKVQAPESGTANPHYLVTYSAKAPAMKCFSKEYDHPFNKCENFAAVMNCSEAATNCPFILGVALRVAVSYNDPKEADNTAQETATYDERCLEIATEMFYVMSQLNR